MSDSKKIENRFFVSNISKSYGKKEVLKNVCFDMPFNSIVGLFGLNGSGKTTLFNILSGIDWRFDGELGNNDFKDISYMTVNNMFAYDFRVKDLIEIESIFMKRQDLDKIHKLLDEIDVNEKTFFRNLSTGIRQYVKFVITIYSGASICLLDEPFANLDINLKDKVSNMLINEINEDRLFVVATHDVKEIERLIDGFYILHNHGLSDYLNANDVVEKHGISIEEYYRRAVYE